jgi:hypothetical protein
MYIDTNTNDVYRSNGGTSWTFVNNIQGDAGPAGADGDDGAAGANGTRGSLWTSGAGVPSAANNAGDMYLRTATNIGDVYQGNGGTSWTLVGNIRGATGLTGNTGNTGPAGADGNPNIFYNACTSDVVYNTTETTVLTLPITSTGTYVVEVQLVWESTVTSSFAINYTGSHTGASSDLSGVRLAGSIAHIDRLDYNTLSATSTATPQMIILTGILVVTGTGNLTISMDNASSGTSAVKRGTFLRASK